MQQTPFKNQILLKMYFLKLFKLSFIVSKWKGKVEILLKSEDINLQETFLRNK